MDTTATNRKYAIESIKDRYEIEINRLRAYRETCPQDQRDSVIDDIDELMAKRDAEIAEYRLNPVDEIQLLEKETDAILADLQADAEALGDKIAVALESHDKTVGEATALAYGQHDLDPRTQAEKDLDAWQAESQATVNELRTLGYPL